MSDIKRILDIWLKASIEAHNFVPSTYWESKANDMREIYLPASENYVYQKHGEIFGFISIYQSNLAALFVLPSQQGNGIGSELIKCIKDKYNILSLSVYKDNKPSLAFYKKHGFVIVGEQLDEHTGHSEIIMKLDL